MVDYIGSDTIKKYYEENGIVLPDRMIAARICKAGFNMREIHSSLREIQARTEDVNLKEQIDIYISRELLMYERMKKSALGDIYKLSVWYERDDDYCEEGYFGSFSAALSMIQDMKKKEDDVYQYKIEKFHVVDESQLPFTEEYGSAAGDADGCAEFDRDGELFYVWVLMEEDEEEWEELFDVGYYTYPHPFQRGDLLRRIGDEETLYIVNMYMDPEREAAYMGKIASWGDYSDIGISTMTISRRTGRIWDMDERTHPYEFEYARIDRQTEDVIEQAALEIQAIMQGRCGSLQLIYDACVRRKEDYIESKRVSLITGIRIHPYSVDWE